MNALKEYIIEKLVIDKDTKSMEVRRNKTQVISQIFYICHKCFEKEYFFDRDSWSLSYYDEHKVKTVDYDNVWFVEATLKFGNPTDSIISQMRKIIADSLNKILPDKNITATRLSRDVTAFRIYFYDPE